MEVFSQTLILVFWQDSYLAKDCAKVCNESAKAATPPGGLIQLRSLSKRPRIFKADARSALYSEALRSAAQRWVWASSLASCKQFSK